MGSSIVGTVLLAALVVSSPVRAADSGDAPARAQAGLLGSQQTSGQVVVFNRPIIRFRVPLLGVPVEQRADDASARIHRLLAAPGKHAVTSEQTPQGVVIRIDGNIAFAVSHDDADRLGEIAEAALAADAVRRLDQAIAEMKEARDPGALLASAGWAAIATLIWLAALWLLLRMTRAIARRLFRYAEAKGRELHAAGTEIVQRERVIEVIRAVLRVAFWVVALLLTYQWLSYVLDRFPYTRPWGEGLAAFLVETLVGMLSAVAGSFPGLVVAVAIFAIAHVADRMLGSFFDGVQQGRLTFNWIDPDTARPTRRLVKIAVWLFAIAMAYPHLPGAQTDAFKGVSVLLGLMVSVGASGIVAQAASGLILMYTRTYRPGEHVRIADHEGTVVALGMFTTRVRTGMGEELTLPNSMVLGAVTKNYSRALDGPGYVVDATVTIGYDTPWRQVHAMLIEAARRTRDVAHEIAPAVFQTALTDFYVEYRLVCQATATKPAPRAVAQSALHANIQDVFNENGVQIMSPHYLGDPKQPKVVPPDRWHEPPASKAE